jgi:hypothetical protein
MSIKDSKKNITDDTISYGNVYIMTHSIFSNVIRIGCTPNDTSEYSKSISENILGDYELYFSLACNNPCRIKKLIKMHFKNKKYVNEFYEVDPETAKNILKREVMKIPILSIH